MIIYLCIFSFLEKKREYKKGNYYDSSDIEKLSPEILKYFNQINHDNKKGK